MSAVNPPGGFNILTRDLLKLTTADPPGGAGDVPPPDLDSWLDLPPGNQLPTLPPSGRMLGGLSLETLVAALNNEERKTATKTGLETLEAKAQERQEANQKRLDELIERLEKMRARGPLEIFLKIFKIIALVVSAIASVATIAAGAVTGNPLLVAAGVFMAAMVLDSIIGEATDGKVSIAAGVTALAKACGAGDEAAKWIGFGVTIGLAVIGAALSFGSGFASSASKLSAEAATMAMRIVLTSSRVANFAGGVLALGTGAGAVGEAVLDYQTQQSHVRTKELEAILQRLQTAIENEQDFLEIIMKKYQDLMGKVTDIVKDNNEAQTQILSGDFSAPPMA